MEISAIYWLLLLLWGLSLLGAHLGWPYAVYVSGGFLFVLFVLVGLKVMGPPLK